MEQRGGRSKLGMKRVRERIPGRCRGKSEECEQKLRLPTTRSSRSDRKSAAGRRLRGKSSRTSYSALGVGMEVRRTTRRGPEETVTFLRILSLLGAAGSGSSRHGHRTWFHDSTSGSEKAGRIGVFSRQCQDDLGGAVPGYNQLEGEDIATLISHKHESECGLPEKNQVDPRKKETACGLGVS